MSANNLIAILNLKDQYRIKMMQFFEFECLFSSYKSKTIFNYRTASSNTNQYSSFVRLFRNIEPIFTEEDKKIEIDRLHEYCKVIEYGVVSIEHLKKYTWDELQLLSI